ncbi:rhomboid family intramembrane serine protease [Pseudofulvibacter geojedonensis]|uniref:Rhomboid family intramembrane serine protease n=1 Tax=Pseudofulvibacter geojedonensis TaxID=1123758 RepID=A0ABW3HZ77_9FLAO
MSLGLDFSIVVIIALNVLISFKGFNDFSFFEKYKFNVGAVKAGQQYRNITSGFLHADMPHLLFNMVTLYFFAPFLVQQLDSYKFILVYVVSLLMGSLLSFGIHKENNYYSAIGASGAVTGVIYAAVTMFPEMKLYMFFAIPIKGWIFGILYLAYSIYGMKKSVGNIGHAAHFGGAMGGYALALILKPEILSQNLFYTILIGLPILALFILMKLKKI